MKITTSWKVIKSIAYFVTFLSNLLKIKHVELIFLLGFTQQEIKPELLSKFMEDLSNSFGLFQPRLFSILLNSSDLKEGDLDNIALNSLLELLQKIYLKCESEIKESSENNVNKIKSSELYFLEFYENREKDYSELSLESLTESLVDFLSTDFVEKIELLITENNISQEWIDKSDLQSIITKWLIINETNYEDGARDWFYRILSDIDRESKTKSDSNLTGEKSSVAIQLSRIEIEKKYLKIKTDKVNEAGKPLILEGVTLQQFKKLRGVK